MGGHALSHKLGSTLFILPSPKFALVIGLDTEHVQGQHDLWRHDCKSEPSEIMIASIRRHGILQPIRARKLPKSDAIDSEHLKLNADEYVEVVMGRDRIKAARVVEAGGKPVVVPCLLWPAGTPTSEIMGAMNAENFVRKTESLDSIIEHVWMQMVAEGYGNGVEELDCAKAVAVSTGMSVQRIRNLLAFREDDRLVRAVRAGTIGGEAALAIATMPDEADRAAELEKIVANPELGTVAQVRERVAIKKATTKAETQAAAPSTPSAKKATKAKAPRAEEGPALGLSKALQKRIVSEQLDRTPDERDLDPLVLKTLKVCSGMAAPSTVPGFTKALKALGL